MSLSTVISGRTVQANDINQLVKVLQQPGGGQEKGKYFLAMPGYANNATISTYLSTLSRGSSPVSVSVDSSDQAQVGLNNSVPSTSTLTSGGFQIYNGSNGAQGNPYQGGNYTVQY